MVIPFSRLAAPIALLLALLLAGCGGGAPAAPAAAPTAAMLTSAERVAPGMTATPAPAATAAPAGGAASRVEAPADAPAIGDPNRKIIKDAQMSLEVADIDLALSRVDGIAAQAGGYVLETSTNYSDVHQKFAYVRIAVPVDQFEASLQRLREGASRVLSEQASGVDVTQEYTDIQSQIANLEATQARIREFLDQAKTVEEALKVNAQLTEIEGQLSQLKGRLQFLSQRAAYSTITVQLQLPPPPTPTPVTPTPTPTPEPIWNPEKTTAQASTTLLTIVQSLATVLLWFVIVVVPLLIPVILAIILARWLTRRGSRTASPPNEER